MATYIIGDIHGCYDEFTALLKKIAFDPKRDRLYLCGDVVARGKYSLKTLRTVKALSDSGALFMVLGNHDVTLIATWLGILPIKPKDKTAEIFAASDGDSLLDWLRHQPFLRVINAKSLLVHAGIPPQWRTQDALFYADELQALFAGDLDKLRQCLPCFYQKTPKHWGNASERLGLIGDYLTRMRLCDKAGKLDFTFKGGIGDPKPAGFRAWFDWRTDRAERIYFGHWAALQGKINTKTVCNLDGGCVWGGRLLAYDLDSGTLYGVAANH